MDIPYEEYPTLTRGDAFAAGPAQRPIRPTSHIATLFKKIN